MIKNFKNQPSRPLSPEVAELLRRARADYHDEGHHLRTYSSLSQQVTSGGIKRSTFGLSDSLPFGHCEDGKEHLL